MGEDHEIPPYAPRARHAAHMAARKEDCRHRYRMLQDADEQEQQGRRALVGAAHDRRAALLVCVLSAIIALTLLYHSWAADDFSEQGFMLATWALLGGTIMLGVLYLALGAVSRASQRKEAGSRLLRRAARQRERAGDSR